MSALPGLDGPPLLSLLTTIQHAVDTAPTTALPDPATARSASSLLHTQVPRHGLGTEPTLQHILTDITPNLSGQSLSPHYYGFVTGSVLPVAEAADRIVTAWDQNVQVHLPAQSISTVVEDRALGMVRELVGLGSKGEEWGGRTFTTGATGSNVLGLGCGREAVVGWRSAALGGEASCSRDGVLEACARAGVRRVVVLGAMAHSSMGKAARILGIGEKNVIDCGMGDGEPWRLDLDKVERYLQEEGVAAIVVVSCGEVNTGRSGCGVGDMGSLRRLCDRYKAWLHVDGAFGLFARALPETEEFTALRDACEGIGLADSITGDAHKMLNVPYDCGFFLTKSLSTLQAVCQNSNSPYLTSEASSEGESIPSPLNISLENSRRFRALPVYAVLLSLGREGFAQLFANQVRLARRLAAWIDDHPYLELLPSKSEDRLALTHIIVILRAKDQKLNDDLASEINARRTIMVSGTKWEGKPATRIAISTWKVDVERDFRVVTGVLQDVLRGI